MGLEYCRENGIEVTPRVRILYGQGGCGLNFSKEDDIRVIRPDLLSEERLYSLVSSFLAHKVDIPEELEAYMRAAWEPKD